MGLLGGSFDPIHFGHLVMGEEARVQLGLHRVVFIPAGVPPHKLGKRHLSGPEHRMAMTRLAIDDNQAFDVSSYELHGGGRPTFTIDTLRHFHALHGAESELYFILGLDSFLEIGTWKDHARLLEFGHLIVATRAGYDQDTMRKDVPPPFLERLSTPNEGVEPAEGARVWPIEIPPVATSSTELRRRQRDGASIRYLVPDPVWHYIQGQDLYGNHENEE